MPNTVPADDAGTARRKTRPCRREVARQLRLLYRRHARQRRRAEAGARTPGIKIFIGSSTGDLLVDEQAALERIFAETTLPISAHCEDEATVRAQHRAACRHDRRRRSLARFATDAPRLIATKRAIDLANRHNHRFHVLHVSTAAKPRLLAGGSSRALITARSLPASSCSSTSTTTRGSARWCR